ncbi:MULTISPECIES: thioesterase II family protein [Streptomyces]|uniref:Thioesterase n=1 Tax=Streptomyces dengpaensis TaxID=2049881 RepID=A0ABN5HU67_9ACTN|nr:MULTISPECIES: thioesterase domain-containing protein [Streptomyces]AVH54679.1 thioesterase [Streptomyces dengpaensis]PIB05151.1 thioesterase [Streptomyces sp. HG99]
MPIAGRPPRWFLREPLPDARARVFLLPYSGCGASMYRHWPSEYQGVNFVPVQLPGRENRLREQPFETYQELGRVLSEVLEPHLDGPYALFGHCSAALAAYETAVQAVGRGARPPQRLFVSSEVAPQDGPYGRHLQMDDEELAEELRGLIVQLGGNPLPTFVGMTLGVLRRDIEVNRRYHLTDPPKLPCPITAIGWSGDVGMEPERMTGWAACGEMDQVVFDGGHYGFIEGPEKLLRLLADGVTADRPSTGPAGGRSEEAC